MADTNKVKFGIKSCYYALLEEAVDGTISYSAPVSFPGAVSLTMDPQGGDPEPFYADDIVYYQAPGSNTGYSGDFEVARVIDSFRKDVLGEIEDANGMLVESADVMPKPFALIAQFSGDKHNTRHVWYNCTASRPGSGSSTIEEQATPQTETITITGIAATFGEHHVIKAKATPDNSVYDAFFTQVQIPNIEEPTNSEETPGADDPDPAEG